MKSLHGDRSDRINTTEQEEKERAEEDDIDEVPEYMKSPKGEDLIYREKLTEELELERMPGTPFDRHELSLGSKVAGEFFDADFYNVTAIVIY